MPVLPDHCKKPRLRLIHVSDFKYICPFEGILEMLLSATTPQQSPWTVRWPMHKRQFCRAVYSVNTGWEYEA